MAGVIEIATVAVGTAAGAPTRYLTDRFVQSRHDQIFPWGTFTVNVTGSAILGFLIGLSLHHGLPSFWLLLLGTGFCGGLTTFSTFGYENLRLVEDDAILETGVNIGLNVSVGLLAAVIGVMLTALL